MFISHVSVHSPECRVWRVVTEGTLKLILVLVLRAPLLMGFAIPQYWKFLAAEDTFKRLGSLRVLLRDLLLQRLLSGT